MRPVKLSKGGFAIQEVNADAFAVMVFDLMEKIVTMAICWKEMDAIRTARQKSIGYAGPTHAPCPMPSPTALLSVVMVSLLMRKSVTMVICAQAMAAAVSVESSLDGAAIGTEY